MANAGFPDAGDYRTPEGLSSSELWYGYFVAVDATLMTKLYEDTDKFIGAKFTAPEIYNGRVYLPTFSGEIRTYGYDTDGDGVPDTMDNCPTVSNADQANANEDAERILAGAGMPVLLGDACDPNATTSFSSLGPTTDGVQVPCTQMLIGCSSSTSTQTTCTRQFNTNLTFSAHIGNDTGTASPASGTTGPAFCPCQFTNQYLCLQSSQGGCPGGNDSHFPALDGGAFTDWKSISQLAPDGSAQWFSPLNLTHVEPPNLVASSTFATGWDYPYDVSRLGGANSDAGLCDAGLCGLQGELWSHVMTFTPNNDAGENALVPNLNNSYRAATAQYLPPQYPPSLQPCTIPQYQPWLWGQIFWGQQGWAQDPTWLYPLSSGVTVQSGSFASDATSSFTQNALSVLEPLTGGSSPSFLLMSDGARSLGTTNVLGAVMTPIAGTTNVMLADALVANGNQVDVVTAISGATQNVVSYGVIEALDPETGKLYALTQNGSTETLVTLDAVHALNNWLYAQTSVALSGTAFSTPLAMQYSDANGKLYLLDQVPSAGYALRLSSITTGGVMTELWRTRSVDRLPAAFLSATPQGTLVVSIQSGTSYNDAMVVDGNGVPLASYNNPNSGMRTRALLGTGGGLWFPVETTSPASGRITLTPAFQPRLVSGICGTTWFKSEAGSTGILATAAAACNPITNGGFETGTLLDWTTSGASVTISTSAHSGSFSAMLGSTSPTNGDSTVQQTFVVPGTGGTLTLWYKNVCPDTVYYDWFIATLQNTSGQTLATIVPKTCTALGSWTQATLNLASWAGQSVVVVMTSHDDNYPSDPTYSFVDDIGVQ